MRSPPSLTRAFAVALAATCLYPIDAAAESLIDCVPNQQNPNARLPIGDPGDDGEPYRMALRQFLAGTGLADVDYGPQWWPNATAFSDDNALMTAPIVGLGVYDYIRGTGTVDTNGNAVPGNGYTNICKADWAVHGWALSPTEERQVEQWLVNREIGAYGRDYWRRLLLEPQVFTLAHILDTTTCEARVPAFASVSQFTFQTGWDYPGNLFLQAPDAALRRFAVYLALDLIQFDWATWQGASAVGPLTSPYPLGGTQPLPGETFLHRYTPPFNSYPSPIGHLEAGDIGDRLLMWARIYEAIVGAQPAWLTAATDDALQRGLARAAERLARLDLGGGQVNRHFQAVHALAATKRALINTPWHALTTDLHDSAISRFLAAFHWAGYFGDDDARYDLAYNTHNMRHLVRALMADPGTVPQNIIGLHLAAWQMGRLEAHLTFTDRTGRHYTPSAMSVRTGSGVVAGGRQVAPSAAFAWNYLMAEPFGVPHAYARARDLDLVGPFDGTVETNQIDPRSNNPDFHAEIICRQHPNWDPFPWLPQFQPFPGALASQTNDGLSPIGRQYSRPYHEAEGYSLANGSPLRNFADAIDLDPSEAWLPFEVSGPNLADFEEEFVFAKFGGEGIYLEGDPTPGETTYDAYVGGRSDFAVMFHLGPVSGNHSTCLGESIARGYGGGQIAALWAPGGGVFSLSRRKGYNNPGLAGCDLWTAREWITLPQHAVTLLDDASRVATSGRIPLPIVDTHFTAAAITGATEQAFLDNGPGALAGVPATSADSAKRAFLQVEGPFSDRRYPSLSAGPVQTIPTDIGYRRRFVVGESGLRVRTELYALTSTIPPHNRVAQPQKGEGEIEYPLPMPVVFEAWESLPLWLAEGDTATGFVATEVTVYAQNSLPVVVPAPAPLSEAQAYSGVTRVEVTREAGTMTITFADPQTIAFSDDWRAHGGSHPSRNLLIDLTRSRISSANAGAGQPQPEPLQPVTIDYRIRFSR